MTFENTAASRSRTDPVPAFDLLGKTGQQSVDGWLRSSNHLMEGSLALVIEWMAFGRSRMGEDIASFKAFSACKDLSDLTECQRLFAEQAMKQYTEQFAKMGDQFKKILTGAAPVQSAASAAAKSH